jgi:hypothetical protein
MITVLNEQSETIYAQARADGEDLWISAPEFEAATGWSMKPEGLCRGDICLPVPREQAADFVDGDVFNAPPSGAGCNTRSCALTPATCGCSGPVPPIALAR